MKNSKMYRLLFIFVALASIIAVVFSTILVLNGSKNQNHKPLLTVVDSSSTNVPGNPGTSIATQNSDTIYKVTQQEFFDVPASSVGSIDPITGQKTGDSTVKVPRSLLHHPTIREDEMIDIFAMAMREKSYVPSTIIDEKARTIVRQLHLVDFFQHNTSSKQFSKINWKPTVDDFTNIIDVTQEANSVHFEKNNNIATWNSANDRDDGSGGFAHHLEFDDSVLVFNEDTVTKAMSWIFKMTAGYLIEENGLRGVHHITDQDEIAALLDWIIVGTEDEKWQMIWTHFLQFYTLKYNGTSLIEESEWQSWKNGTIGGKYKVSSAAEAQRRINKKLSDIYIVWQWWKSFFDYNITLDGQIYNFLDALALCPDKLLNCVYKEEFLRNNPEYTFTYLMHVFNTISYDGENGMDSSVMAEDDDTYVHAWLFDRYTNYRWYYINKGIKNGDIPFKSYDPNAKWQDMNSKAYKDLEHDEWDDKVFEYRLDNNNFMLLAMNPVGYNHNWNIDQVDAWIKFKLWLNNVDVHDAYTDIGPTWNFRTEDQKLLKPLLQNNIEENSYEEWRMNGYFEDINGRKTNAIWSMQRHLSYRFRGAALSHLLSRKNLSGGVTLVNSPWSIIMDGRDDKLLSQNRVWSFANSRTTTWSSWANTWFEQRDKNQYPDITAIESVGLYVKEVDNLYASTVYDQDADLANQLVNAQDKDQFIDKAFKSRWNDYWKLSDEKRSYWSIYNIDNNPPSPALALVMPAASVAIISAANTNAYFENKIRPFLKWMATQTTDDKFRKIFVNNYGPHAVLDFMYRTCKMNTDYYNLLNTIPYEGMQTTGGAMGGTKVWWRDGDFGDLTWEHEGGHVLNAMNLYNPAYRDHERNTMIQQGWDLMDLNYMRRWNNDDVIGQIFYGTAPTEKTPDGKTVAWQGQSGGNLLVNPVPFTSPQESRQYMSRVLSLQRIKDVFMVKALLELPKERWKEYILVQNDYGHHNYTTRPRYSDLSGWDVYFREMTDSELTVFYNEVQANLDNPLPIFIKHQIHLTQLNNSEKGNGSTVKTFDGQIDNAYEVQKNTSDFDPYPLVGGFIKKPGLPGYGYWAVGVRVEYEIMAITGELSILNASINRDRIEDPSTNPNNVDESDALVFQASTAFQDAVEAARNNHQISDGGYCEACGKTYGEWFTLKESQAWDLVESKNTFNGLDKETIVNFVKAGFDYASTPNWNNDTNGKMGSSDTTIGLLAFLGLTTGNSPDNMLARQYDTDSPAYLPSNAIMELVLKQYLWNNEPWKWKTDAYGVTHTYELETPKPNLESISDSWITEILKQNTEILKQNIESIITEILKHENEEWDKEFVRLVMMLRLCKGSGDINHQFEVLKKAYALFGKEQKNYTAVFNWIGTAEI